jgi:hypothetical protein
VLNANMKATFSPEEAKLLWKEIGEPNFNQKYFDRQVAEFDNKNKNKDQAAFTTDLGAWLEKDFTDLPPPAAQAICSTR